MNGKELLNVVDTLQRDKQISKEVIFATIEKAVRLAMHKRYEDEEGIDVNIDRTSGEILARRGEQAISPDDLGRIAAQAAKQAIIQLLREEESKNIVATYSEQKGELVHGSIQRFEGGAALVSLGKSEALLPRSEQIPGESHHVNERIKAVILEVKKTGHRVKIILSRTHPDFVRRLFENEIPEIEDRTIEIKAVAREAGHRTKVAVSSIDMKVDCVGACVGVRGSRIRNIVDELGGVERIDIVRWNDSLQVLIPNALQPAEIEEVFLYSRLGRAIVLVKEDQLSLAIGRRGQNVRLASKLVGWDIEIMTHDELNTSVEQAELWFREIPGITDEAVEAFIEEGLLSFDDLTCLEMEDLAELMGVTVEQAEEIAAFAEQRSEEVEKEQRQAKAAEPVATSTPTLSSSSAYAKAVKLLGPAEPTQEEPRPTVESLLGPADPTPTEEEAPAESVAEEPVQTEPAPASEVSEQQ
jgi:N utilization substance protein A